MRNKANGQFLKLHGEGHPATPRYAAWQQMWQRCNNSRHADYHNYGARGITVCERWRSYGAFVKDMGPHPGKGWSVDRWPNNNGNYEPTNCRWGTAKMQGRNRRTNR